MTASRRPEVPHAFHRSLAHVQAYVPYLHFVERLYLDASTQVAHGAEEGTHDVRTKQGTGAEHIH